MCVASIISANFIGLLILYSCDESDITQRNNHLFICFVYCSRGRVLAMLKVNQVKQYVHKSRVHS